MPGHEQDICSQCDLLAKNSHTDLTHWLNERPWSELIQLFDCHLPNIGQRIPASEYGKLIMTKPMFLDWSSYAHDDKVTITGEYWHVHWAGGIDTKPFFSNVLEMLNNDLLNSLVYIKKEFPEQNADSEEWISGWTTFGFNDKRDAMVDTTPNRLFSILLKDEGQEHSVLMMKYLNSPWYYPQSHKSYVDYFKFLTEKVVIAKGLRGCYLRDDRLPPENPEANFYQQFWMERKPLIRTVSLSDDTDFFSTSIPMTTFTAHGMWI